MQLASMLMLTVPRRQSLMILLARHASHAEVGTVLSGRSEIALDDRGKDEAARLAERLARLPLSKIHSSPRRRAMETASIVARGHGLAVETVDDLDEIDFGEWMGRSFRDLDDEPDWQRWNAHRGSAATPSGETMWSAAERALRHLEAIDAGDVVVCVTHCDIIRAIVAYYLGLSADRMFAFDIDPASVTTLDRADGRTRIVALNERIH